MSSRSLRLDPNNDKDRALIERTQGGKEELRKYYKGKNLNQENNTHINHRGKNLNTTQITESSQKGQKYGNHKTLDLESGNIIDSKWEFTILNILRNFQDKNIISDLSTQFIYQVIVNDVKICKLKLDYTFIWNGNKIYADAKSTATSPPGFRLKKRLFEALTGCKIHLIIKGKSSIIEQIEEYARNIK